MPTDLPLAGADPRDMFRARSAKLGGHQPPLTFTERQRVVLNAIVDEIIPEGDGFPAPSSVRVVEDFFSRYITPANHETNRFPYAREAEFLSAIDAMADTFLAADHDGRVEQLRDLEKDDPDFFGQLRALSYGGYYSRPAVVVALRSLRGGRDYHGPPLPYGYDLETADWGELRPAPIGSYIATEDVAPVSLVRS